ncbi:MAG TPA: O-antigen ligase family protein [Acidimicrobiales bacterium]|nr:O-antigen ligase family protein [Acidimicrobiales bacterium]
MTEQVLEPVPAPAPTGAPLAPTPSAVATTTGWAVAVGVFLLATAVIPELETTTLPVKVAVLIVLGAAGLPMLAARAVGRSARRSASETWAARASVAFVAVSALAMALSLRPVLSAVGLYQQFDGWLFIVALAGCWALGTALNDVDRHLLESSIIAAAVVNAVMAIFEEFFDVSRIGLPQAYPSIVGLLGNPVFLCALLAGSLALLGTRFRQVPRQWWLPVALIGVGLGLGAERLGLVLAVVVAGFEVWDGFGAPGTGRVGPAVRAQQHRALGFAGLVIGGLLVGSLIGRLRAATGGALSHLASSTAQGTYGQRFGAWASALHAIAHRPLIGYGPGQFRSATSAYYSYAAWRIEPGSQFSDAHNIFLQYATTTGLLGLAALVVWLVFAFGHRRGRLVGFALILLVSELVEPVNAVITPLAFMALGAAALSMRDGAPPPGTRAPRWAGWTAVVCAALAAVPAVALVVGDAALNRSAAQFSVAQDQDALVSAGTANTLLSPWPEPATRLSLIHQYLALGHHHAQAADAIGWAKVALARDPTYSFLITNVANSEALSGHLNEASATARRALVPSPFWYPAMNILGTIAFVQHHDQLGRYWLRRSLHADPNQPYERRVLGGKCPPVAPGGNPFTHSLSCIP